MKKLTLLTPHLLTNLNPQPKEYSLYDAQCEGLALRIQPSGTQSWVTWKRVDGKSRRITLGKHPEMSPEQARTALIRMRTGLDPTPDPKMQTITFAVLASLFVEHKLPKYKPSARGPFKDYLRSQLIPAFGHLQVSSITPAKLADWFYRYSRERPGGANQAKGHFTTIFNWGQRHGHIPHNLPNPASTISRNKRLPRGRMLNSKQLRAVWDILEHPPLRCAQAVDPIKLMLLTACRSGEILGLTWDEVKPTRLELKTANSGPREEPLNKPAQKLLKSLRKENFSRFVFPSEKSKSGHLMCIDQSWRTIKARAGLPDDFRIHDLRHTYASHAILSGETLTMTGRLLGHASLHSTQRYAHLDGSILVKASEKVSKEIAKLMQ
jgi:integrase